MNNAERIFDGWYHLIMEEAIGVTAPTCDEVRVIIKEVGYVNPPAPNEAICSEVNYLQGMRVVAQ